MGRLRFYKNTDRGFVARQLSEVIRLKLEQGRDVTWLLSGGSTIAVAVETASLLAGEVTSGLTVGLVDERYGTTGHANSNWRQLESAGFNLDGARLVPLIKGLDFTATTEEYDKFIATIARQNSYKIGLLGIGVDGHTAGILPNSPAVDSDKYVDGYEADDYKRITLSGKGLRVLDKAVVYATGQTKRITIECLSKTIPATEQPAQLLKQIGDLDVYNDVIGDNV